MAHTLLECPCDIVQIVWGDRFAHYLCDYSLPLLLAPHNLPAWPYCKQTQLVIYCPPSDKIKMEDHPTIKAIQQWIAVIWETIDVPNENESKYLHMSLIHVRAIQRAMARQASLILLLPDMIYGEQTLAALADFIAQGVQMVLVSSPLVHIERFEKAFHQYPHPRDWTRDRISDLILHSGLESVLWADFNAEKFTVYPSRVYYRQGNRMMARQFHLHPLFILNPKPLVIDHSSCNPTFDGDYLCEYQDDVNIHVVTQREIMVFSFHEDDAEKYPGLALNPIERQNYIYIQAASLWKPLHYHFFSHEIWLGNLDDIAPPDPFTPAALDLVYFTLVCNQAYTVQDNATLISMLPVALELVPKIIHYISSLSIDLFGGFVCLCAGLYQLPDKTTFIHAVQLFQPFFQYLCQPPQRESAERQLLQLALAEEQSAYAAFVDAFPEINWQLPYTLVFVGPGRMNAALDNILQCPFATEQVLLCVPVSLLGEISAREAQLGSLNKDVAVLVLEEIQMGHLCALVDHAQQVLAGSDPAVFLPCLRAAKQGKFAVKGT